MSTKVPLPPPAADSPPRTLAPQVIRKPRRLPGDRGPAPRLALAWATFFGAGYVPVAPGTAGTIAALPLWWLLSHLPWPLYLIATAAVAVTGMAAAQRAGRYYGVADSGHIVIDEVAGYLMTMFLLPRGWLSALGRIAFLPLVDLLEAAPSRLLD